MRIGIGVDGSTIDLAIEGVRRAKADGFAPAWFSNIFAADGITLCALAGREVDGIGLSHQVDIEGMFGLSYDKPARHMREYLARTLL